MPLKTQYSRQLLKRSTVPNEVPFVTTGSTDHLDGTWINNQIYPGEMYLNMADRKLYYAWETLSGSGVVEIAKTSDITGSTGGGNFLPLSGGTVTGNTNFTQGLTATTFSAITYQGLPLDITLTGGTYSGGTLTFRNNTGGTITITGLTDRQTLIMDSGTYAVSNTTAETIVRAVEITSDKWKTLAAYDLKILGQFQASSTVNNTIKLYINSASTLNGTQTLIGEGYVTSSNAATSNSGTTIGIIKTLWKDGNVLTYDRGTSTVSTSNVFGNIDISVISNTLQKNVFDTTLTFTSSLYLIITCQMATAATGVITRIKKIYLTEV